MKSTKDWFDEANTLYESGKFLEADERLDEVLALDNKFMQAYRWKFKLFYSLGQYGEMIKWCDKATEVDPNYFFAYNSKGNALRQLGEPALALEAYNKAISIDPHQTLPHNGKGNVLRDLGRHVEALAAYEEGLKFNPDNECALMGKALELTLFERFEEARETFDKCIQRNPRNTLCLCNRGRLLMSIGRLEEGLDDFREIKRLLDSGYVDVDNNSGTRRFVKQSLKAVEQQYNLNDQPENIVNIEQDNLAGQQLSQNGRIPEENKKDLDVNIENNCGLDKDELIEELERLKLEFKLIQEDLANTNKEDKEDVPKDI